MKELLTEIAGLKRHNANAARPHLVPKSLVLTVPVELLSRIDAALEVEAPAEPLYYLQDSRSFTGNCPLWWKAGGNGYTTSLEKAHRYTLADAMKQHQCRHTDVPWPCERINALRRLTVDSQDMGSVKKQAAQIRAEYAAIQIVKGLEA